MLLFLLQNRGKEANTTTSIVKSIDNGGEKIWYTYDKNGNIETITQNKGTEKEKTIKYYYDGLNQIIREDNGILEKTITYSYDRGGNLTSKKEYNYTTAESLGNCTKAYTYNYGDSIWKDKLTNFDGKEITYDNIGNPLTYNGYTFTWERGRMLSTIKGNGKDIKFKYNDQGIRTEKTVNGVTTKYHLVGVSVTYEDNGIDKIHYTYDSSGKLISMNLNGAEYYYVRNAQGDIIGLIDAQGEKVVSYTYDSWGKLIFIEGSLKDTVGEKNPYRYRGYRYDSETGLYYLQSRYYNPEWGRFINADGIIGEKGELLSHNIFAYCNNNFANFNDPSGYLCCSANYEYGGGGGGAIAIPLVSGGLKDCLKGLGYGAIGTIKAIGAALSGKAYLLVKSKVKTRSTSGKSVSNTGKPHEKAKAKGVPRDEHSVVPHSIGAKNPNVGKPNSSSDLLNQDGSVKQRRYYGPDSKPELDIDFNHPGEETHIFPHSHTWDWSQPKPRLPWGPWVPKE